MQSSNFLLVPKVLDRLRVLDRGTGMSANTMEHALLPFYTTKQSGSGIGLSLCREIVDAHGGQISLENRIGGGVCVRVLLPNAPR